MIKNTSQLNKAIKELEGWAASFAKMKSALPEEAFALYEANHQPQVDQLEREIEDFQRLLEGDPAIYCSFATPSEVGRWLMKTRIINKLTQATLAKRVYWTQAQVSRHEKSDYQNIPFIRVFDIARALGYKHLSICLSKEPFVAITKMGSDASARETDVLTYSLDNEFRPQYAMPIVTTETNLIPSFGRAQ